MHAKHNDQDLAQTFGVDTGMTDADEQGARPLEQVSPR
jgi:hypothetical protein